MTSVSAIVSSVCDIHHYEFIIHVSAYDSSAFFSTTHEAVTIKHCNLKTNMCLRSLSSPLSRLFPLFFLRVSACWHDYASTRLFLNCLHRIYRFNDDQRSGMQMNPNYCSWWMNGTNNVWKWTCTKGASNVNVKTWILISTLSIITYLANLLHCKSVMEDRKAFIDSRLKTPHWDKCFIIIDNLNLCYYL